MKLISGNKGLKKSVDWSEVDVPIYEEIFSKLEGKQSRTSTIDSGIAIGKHLNDFNSVDQQCLLTEEIVKNTKPQFWYSTGKSANAAERVKTALKSDKIEELRQLIQENNNTSLNENDDLDEHLFDKDLQEKFVVNLFECRRSLRVSKRHAPKWPETGKVDIIQDKMNTCIDDTETLLTVDRETQNCEESLTEKTIGLASNIKSMDVDVFNNNSKEKFASHSGQEAFVTATESQSDVSMIYINSLLF